MAISVAFLTTRRDWVIFSPDSRSLIEMEDRDRHLRPIPYHPYNSILLGIYRCDDEHGGDHDFEMDL